MKYILWILLLCGEATHAGPLRSMRKTVEPHINALVVSSLQQGMLAIGPSLVAYLTLSGFSITLGYIGLKHLENYFGSSKVPKDLYHKKGRTLYLSTRYFDLFSAPKGYRESLKIREWVCADPKRRKIVLEDFWGFQSLPWHLERIRYETLNEVTRCGAAVTRHAKTVEI